MLVLDYQTWETWPTASWADSLSAFVFHAKTLVSWLLPAMQRRKHSGAELISPRSGLGNNRLYDAHDPRDSSGSTVLSAYDRSPVRFESISPFCPTKWGKTARAPFRLDKANKFPPVLVLQKASITANDWQDRSDKTRVSKFAAIRLVDVLALLADQYQSRVRNTPPSAPSGFGTKRRREGSTSSGQRFLSPDCIGTKVHLKRMSGRRITRRACLFPLSRLHRLDSRNGPVCLVPVPRPWECHFQLRTQNDV